LIKNQHKLMFCYMERYGRVWDGMGVYGQLWSI